MSTPSHRVYGGAHAVAVIFKIASILVIIGGVISAADLNNDQTYTGNKGALLAGIIGGTIFTAAAVAFFAYVLDLLIGIERNTFSGGPSRRMEAMTQRPVASVDLPQVADPPPMTVLASPQAPVFPQPG